MSERPSKLRPFYGNAVSGAAFWPRPEVVGPLVRSLRNGQSHTMFDLRRIGKSSVTLEVQQRLAAEGVTAVLVNVEDKSGIEGMFGHLLASLPSTGLRSHVLRGLEAAKGVAAPVAASIKGWLGAFGVPTPERDLLEYWPILSRVLRDSLEGYGKPVVLIIDELPFLLENTIGKTPGGNPKGLAVARNILATLSDWRDIPNVAMLVAGSIGMRGLELRHGLDAGAFKGMPGIRLPPLERDEARAMVAALVAGSEPGIEGWTEACTEALLAGIPELHTGLIQLAFQQTAGMHGATTPDAIELTLHNQFRPALNTEFYVQYTRRVQREQKPLRDHILLAIDLAVDAGEAGVALQDLHDALDQAGCADAEQVALVVQEDGFLAFDSLAQRVRPASRLVSAWRHAALRRRRR